MDSTLRDIRGLDVVSWWPLASGWWLLIGLILLSTIIIFYLVKRKQKEQNWRQIARQEWLQLRPLNSSAREQLTFLSILLRRIAVQTHGREACAGLSGDKWLAWLTKNDPQGFDWNESGKILIETPYMPPDAIVEERKLDLIYRAIRAWIDDK
ncbi:DUF4381 domain-containing protein [Candidatus Halobeggiatoa sp. HSG11]|nr:DUF4381 domain-containing protein [Candidatus Halobeggiatoa sp. HSG11]